MLIVALAFLLSGAPRSEGGQPVAVIDMLALYTPLAVQQAGGVSAITAIIRGATDATNVILANSGIPAVIRLVGIERVEYVERPNPSDFVPDREWASFDPGVMTLRNRYNADTVALFTEIPGGSPTVARGEALSLNKRNAGSLHASIVATVDNTAGASAVLAHEIGHTLGGDHALEEAAAAGRVALQLTPEAHDYIDPSKRIVTFLAGVSCSGCRRIPYFSSPAILFEGVPLGIPGQSDNASLFRFTAPVMASYRNAYGPAGYFEFETDPLVVRSDEPQARIRVARQDGTAGAVSVAWRTIEFPNEAVAGVDFVPVSGSLRWEEGEGGVKTLAIPILRTGSTVEKGLGIELYEPGGGAVLNHGSLALLSIQPRERTRAAGSIEFAAAELQSEQGDSAVVTVNRVGGSAGAFTTTAYALEGTARHGRDYDFTVATLTWADGDSTPKTFEVPIRRTTFGGPPRTVKLRFNALPASVGRIPSALLVIHSAPPPPRRRSIAH